MTRAAHLKAALRFGRLAAGMTAKVPGRKRATAYAVEATAFDNFALAIHHAIIATNCRRCNGTGTARITMNAFVRCEGCTGRGWIPA